MQQVLVCNYYIYSMNVFIDQSELYIFLQYKEDVKFPIIHAICDLYES